MRTPVRKARVTPTAPARRRHPPASARGRPPCPPSHRRAPRSRLGTSSAPTADCTSTTCAWSRVSTPTDVTPGTARSRSSAASVDAEGLDLHDRLVGDAGLQVGRRPGRHEAAVRDHRQPLAQLVRLEHVVRREQDRLARLAQARDRLAQLPRADGIEPDRRLVEEEQLGVVQQAARDVQALAHARASTSRRARAPGPPCPREPAARRSGVSCRQRARDRGLRSSAGCRAPRAGRRGRDRRRTRIRCGAVPPAAAAPGRSRAPAPTRRWAEAAW